MNVKVLDIYLSVNRWNEEFFRMLQFQRKKNRSKQVAETNNSYPKKQKTS